MELDRRKQAKQPQKPDYIDRAYVKRFDAGVYRLALVEKVLDGVIFQYFFTGTWKHEPCSLNRATEITNSYFDKYKSKINKQNQGLWYFITSERGGRTGRVHVHGMFGTTEPKDHSPKRIGYHDLWYNWFTNKGRCSIEKIRSQAGINGYCSKYIMKYADPDIVDFNFSDWVKRDGFKSNTLPLGFTVGLK